MDDRFDSGRRGLANAGVALAAAALAACSSSGDGNGLAGGPETWLVGTTTSQQNNGCGAGSLYTIYDSIVAGGALGDAVLDNAEFCEASFNLNQPSYGALAGNAVGFTLAYQKDQESGSGGAVGFNVAGDSGSQSVGSFGSPVISVTAPLADGTFYAGESSSGHLDSCNVYDGGDQDCPTVVEFGSVSVNVLALDNENELLWVGLDDGRLYSCPLGNDPLSCALYLTASSSITAIAVEPSSGDLAFAVYNAAGTSEPAGVTYLPDAGQQDGGSSFTLSAGGTSPGDAGPYAAVEFAGGELFVLYPSGELVSYPASPSPSSTPTSLGVFGNIDFEPTYGKAAVSLASDGTNIFVVSGSGTALLACANGEAPCSEVIEIGGPEFTMAYFQTIGATEPFIIDP